jgi:hypothetical protein
LGSHLEQKILALDELLLLKIISLNLPTAVLNGRKLSKILA